MHKKIKQKRLDVIRRQQDEMMKKYGWVVHYVFDSDGSLNGMANIHTHGLAENYGHPELQIVLPIHQEVAHGVLTGMVEQIKEGRVFEAGKRQQDVLQDMDVYVDLYETDGEKHLRVMLPDPHGLLPIEEGCEEVYRRQLDPLPIA